MLATDADANKATFAITVTVTNVDEAATLTISGLADAMVAENSPYVSTTPMVTTNNLLNASAVTWTLEGDDAGAFTISTMTGVVSMVRRATSKCLMTPT